MDQIRSNALPFFQELRDDRPILAKPGGRRSSRASQDVEEILRRETVFSVSPYLPRMMGVIGPFVLSQDITPGYDRDISIMRLVVQREDLSRVKDIVSRSAAEIVQALFASSPGRSRSSRRSPARSLCDWRPNTLASPHRTIRR